jgi:hypothetical protein
MSLVPRKLADSNRKSPGRWNIAGWPVCVRTLRLEAKTRRRVPRLSATDFRAQARPSTVLHARLSDLDMGLRRPHRFHTSPNFAACKIRRLRRRQEVGQAAVALRRLRSSLSAKIRTIQAAERGVSYSPQDGASERKQASRRCSSAEGLSYSSQPIFSARKG